MSIRSITHLLCMMVFLQGCFFVPMIQAFKETGVTESDRQRLLTEEIKKFGDGLTWGQKSVLTALSKDSARAAVSERFKDIGEDEKIVDVKVKNVTFSENSYKAEVELAVRSYKIPFYTVQTKKDLHKWEFTLTDGWRLVELVKSS